jgi:hypothetical protein
MIKPKITQHRRLSLPANKMQIVVKEKSAMLPLSSFFTCFFYGFLALHLDSLVWSFLTILNK